VLRCALLLLAGCDGVFGIQHINPPPDAAPDAPPDARSTYASIVLADGPVAYFQLDDPAMTTTTVDGVGGLVGHVQGLAMPGAAPPFPGANHAYAFNGVNGSIEVGDVLPFTGNAPFTIEAWVENGREDTQFNYAIVSKWRQPGTIPPSGWLFYYQEGDDLIPAFKIQRQDAAGIGFSATAYATTPGEMWHHVVGTYDGMQLSIYLDGLYGSSHDSMEQLEHLDLPLEIGAQNGNSHDGPALGSIDEVAIYDHALTDTQILAHYNARSL